MGRRIALALILAGALATPAQAAIPAGNLIVDPGGEAGTGATNTTTVVLPPPPWQDRTSQPTLVQYGVAGLPSVAESQRIGGGKNFFAGGPQGGALLGQFDIDLSMAQTEIEAGQVQATVSACLGGKGNEADFVEMWARFSNQAGTTLTETPKLRTPARGGQTKFLPVSATIQVPTPSRVAHLFADFVGPNDGSYGDSYADNFSLVLSRLGTKPPAGPSCGVKPGSGGGGGGGGTGGGGPGGTKSKRALRFGKARLAANGTVRVPVTCTTKEVARCVGTVRAGLSGVPKKAAASKAGVAKFSIAQGKKKTVKVKLRKSARRKIRSLSRRKLRKRRIKVTATTNLPGRKLKQTTYLRIPRRR